MLLTAIAKITFKGKVIGLLCKNSLITSIVLKRNFNNYTYSNIKISKDLKIIGNISEISDNITDYNIVKLYHASHNGINGAICCDRSREKCDFGVGFYTGTDISQVKSLVVDDSAPVLYTFYTCLNDLTVYTFNNDIIWALYVGVNRGIIDCTKYSKLKQLVYNINSYDIIKGVIADDRMYYIYSRFINGEITDKVLIEALKYVNLGYQYTFKSQKACNYLTCIESELILSSERKSLKKVKSRIIGTLPDKIDSLIISHRRDTTGRYVDEILEDFR